MDKAKLGFESDDFGAHITSTFFITFKALIVKSSASPGPTPIPISFPFIIILQQFNKLVSDRNYAKIFFPWKLIKVS
jgi:hypothetical protein